MPDSDNPAEPSEFDDSGFERIPLGDSELPPVPPEFEAIGSAETSAFPTPPAGEAAPVSSSEESSWAMAAHLSAFLTFVVPIPGVSILAPFVIWSMKRDTMPAVDHHAKEAINFNISFVIWTIAAVIVGLLLFVVGLFITLPLVGLVWFVLVIVAAVKASNGVPYRYPFTIRFMK
jgi:uncharacterized Tic20 family protein